MAHKPKYNDFIEARAQRGAIEGEVVNIFHLATLDVKENHQKPLSDLFNEKQNAILYRLFELMLDPEYIENGYQAGWNAALEAAREVVRNGKMG